MAIPAFAQNAQPAPESGTVAIGTPDAPAAVSEIVVTGYARSIQHANSIKKDSVNIIEAISAEDIGKLPDVSIADSLSRLTGVAVQEAAGRAKYISIRGFGPDYTTTTLNGRMIATVDDNRRFDYGQFPGDLFQQIEVIKTPSADLLNFGLAGTVNLQTYDPLTQKNTVAINAQGEVGKYGSLNPDGTNKGYKVSAILMHKFADDTLGVSLGFSAIQDPTQDYHWATGGGSGNYYGPTNPDAAGNIGPDDIQNYVNTNTLYRQSAFGHVVWKPNDRFEMSVDGLYTQSKINELSRGWEMPLASWSKDTQVPNTETSSGGYVQSEQWMVDPVLRNDYNTSRAKTFEVGANIKYAVTDSIKLMVDGSYSHAKRHDNTYEIYSGTTDGGLALATITRKNDGTYGVDISGKDLADPAQVSLTDPQGWNQVGFNNVPDLKDTMKQLRAELKGEIHSGFFKSWQIGANYSDEKKISNYSGYYICLPGAASVAGCGTNDGGQVTYVTIPSSIIKGTVEPYAVTGTQLIAIDPVAAQDLLRTSEQSEASNVARDWTVREKIVTGYLQANYDTDLSGKRVSGNIGLQIVHTDQTSVGYGAIDATNVAVQRGGDSYTDFLPSVNMNIEMAHNLLLRLGASRTLARATMDDENASYSVSSCGTQGCTTVPTINGKIPVLQAQGGNPVLRPYFSNNVDISLEKYFAHDTGKVSAAVYFKDISNFTTQNLNLNSGNVNNGGPTSNTTGTQDCSAFSGLLTTPLTPQQTLSCYSTAPTNDGKGYVFGYELSATFPLKTLLPALDGFSVIGQYAHTESEIKFSNGSRITLPGLSKSIVQAQIFFEKWGFNARASLTHRSSYLGDYQLFNAQVTANLTKPQTTLDAQVGYDFHSGVLNGLSIYVQGHNLTNAKSVSYVNNDPKEVNIRDQYGPTYLAGATFRF
ncbi:TonB-dependent receptor [Sphingomonas abietis]|uniref:TonB-dependent receptor n=1 Tax=Sphingomonas abietis TaxID=3012344 RepID=A0ABY7NHG1_9SPHN|nr:TonB-dependent receptor [Sphingomonas abietis]WBO20702.1 TonB-dependent receptor [Sphingomonas abietis]